MIRPRFFGLDVRNLAIDQIRQEHVASCAECGGDCLSLSLADRLGNRQRLLAARHLWPGPRRPDTAIPVALWKDCIRGSGLSNSWLRRSTS
jgi:hypothetical protein